MFFDSSGLATIGITYQNSWAGAARIWGDLFDRHCKDPNLPFDNWMSSSGNGDRRLWDLAKDSRLGMYARAVHAFTFNNAIVRREHFANLASDLRRFTVEYHSKPGHVDHLPAWAEAIEACDGIAVALHATTVSENPWFNWDEGSEEYSPYCLETGTKHWEVYDALADGGHLNLPVPS
ncbi:hypothetical protein [Blastopirellula marina]|uniref:hypothetical protein n=1 Tax=Blastopirellula marina TaxID=124 RepID=UPI0011B007CE|nr:hypothetical protein [Blastopirellula marina]